MSEGAKKTKEVQVPFSKIAPLRTEWWQAASNGGLSIPLGPRDAQEIQSLVLGQGTAHHALVAGRVGSGKSTLLHTIITGAALSYTPDELELYLIDFKQGVEFKVYATNELPHARVIAVQSEREFGLSVLQGLDAELKERGDRFRAAGVENITNFRAKTHEIMPRILLLVDEFQEFFTEDDTIASQSGLILDRLVRQGRAYGIHILLGSQTLAGSYSLTRSTIDQMGVRIALQCSADDSEIILGRNNTAARLLSRPGEAYYNDANGMIEGNFRFQVAWLPDEQRDTYLWAVREMAEQQHYRPKHPQIVFEGNEPADVKKNRSLRAIAAGDGHSETARTALAWLGEPIAIRDHIAATFRRQSGSNLLIITQNDEAALGMIATALISLAAQVASVARDGASTMSVLDFSATDGPYAEYLAHLTERLPCPVAFGRRRQLPDIIAALATEVQRRIDDDDTSAPTRYLILYGLHRARDLRQEEASFSFSSYGEESPAANPAQQLGTILREGPDVGIHAVVWCDTMTNLNRAVDRRGLREFAMRVACQMNAEDSTALIDVPAASKLGPYRALFQDEEAGRLEKFRPYSIPSEGWLTETLQRVRERQSVLDD